MAKQNKPQAMVNWFNPLLLVKVGWRALVTGILGQYADSRPLQAALDPLDRQQINAEHDYSVRKDIWFDYVADLGDGWDSTFAIASLLACDSLNLDRPDPLPRGEILIMGGDEVYPDPSHNQYDVRMVDPYRTALPSTSGPAPHLYAIPGNHDWYDGLTAFLALFCRKRNLPLPRPGRRIGAWETQQSRSYFAIRLPHNWWIWAVDIQLTDRIDGPQYDYFDNIDLKPKDNVILCTAKPSWIYAMRTDREAYRNVIRIGAIARGKDAHVRAVLAGDMHNYNRYMSGPERTQLITAGGGGAFLHPTHALPDTVKIEWENGTHTEEFSIGTNGDSVPGATEGSDQEGSKGASVPDAIKASDPKKIACYPDKPTSRRLTWRNLGFPCLNPAFAIFMGAVYGVMAWALAANFPPRNDSLASWILGGSGPPALWEVPAQFWRMLYSNPVYTAIAAVLIVALVKFCDRRRMLKQIAMGGIHGLVHIAAGLALMGGMAALNRYWPVLWPGEGWGMFALIAEMVVVGGFVGAIIMGAYLLIALNLFGVHWNDAYSSLGIRDYKNFLRMHLTEDGLTIYPVKIEQVPKTRKLTGSDLEREASRLTEAARLIEDPIHLPNRRP